MTTKINLELKNEKAGTYTIISWLIIALHSFTFSFYSIGDAGGNRIITITSALILAASGIFLRFNKSFRAGAGYFIAAFMIIIITWIAIGNYFMAAINVLLFFLQHVARRKLIVHVMNDRVVYPSFPPKIITRGELNNVVLRDGVLTIDLKNNHVYQHEIVTEINESDFNDFCVRHLTPLDK